MRYYFPILILVVIVLSGCVALPPTGGPECYTDDDCNDYGDNFICDANGDCTACPNVMCNTPPAGCHYEKDDSVRCPSCGEIVCDTECTPNWSCGEWGACRSDGYKVRNCNDLNACDSAEEIPETYVQCNEPNNFQAYIWIEAENGNIESPMQKSGDGSYVYTPIGSTTTSKGSVSFTFDVKERGNYKLNTRVLAADSGSDSFFVGLSTENAKLDESKRWNVEKSSVWTEDYVNWKDVSDPKIWNLDAGTYTFVVYGREANTKIDKIKLEKHTGGIPTERPPSCNDNKQNQGETGIDCGGPCPACVSDDDSLPIRGIMLRTPKDKDSGFDEFIDFIRYDLKNEGVNTIVLSVNYEYQFSSHPDLSTGEISHSNVKKIVSACKEAKIRCIPYMQLLSHQVCYDNDKLLNKYPEFDANPASNTKPAKPSPYGCRSWNTYHPDLHPIVFDLVDEVLDVWEADALHIGFDEMLMLPEYETEKYAGTPYYNGQPWSEIYADEFEILHNHLSARNVQVWLWGDRLISNEQWGFGGGQVDSGKGDKAIHPAIDIISRENVVISDWHYQINPETPEYFAGKSFDVVSSPWNNVDVGLGMADRHLNAYKENNHMKGMLQTTWRNGTEFMRAYKHGEKVTYTSDPGHDMCFNDDCFDWNALTAANTFKAVMKKIRESNSNDPPILSGTIIEDSLQDSTKGTKVGGTITSEGYKPGIGENHILYDVSGPISEGYIEFEMKGFHHGDLPANDDQAFITMYDGRGIGNTPSWEKYRDNYYRWNFHWAQKFNSGSGAFKCVVNTAEDSEKRKNSDLAIFNEDRDQDGDVDIDDRDWYDEPQGSSISWNRNKWYKVKLEWKDKTFIAYVDGQKVWENHKQGLYDYAPIEHKIWLGSGVSKYDSDVSDIIYKNFKLVKTK